MKAMKVACCHFMLCLAVNAGEVVEGKLCVHSDCRMQETAGSAMLQFERSDVSRTSLVNVECNKEPICAIDKCEGKSMHKDWNKNWKWAGKHYDHEHYQLWKSEELGRCMEKYKADKPEMNVDPADMYVICQYSEAKCSSCSCVVSKEAKGTAALEPKLPVASGAEIYLQGGEGLEHWMRKQINGISVWSSTTVVSEEGVFELVQHILREGGKKGTLISGTHGNFAGNTGFEEKGVEEPDFFKDDLKAVKEKDYSGQLRVLSVSGFMAAGKGSDEDIASALTTDDDFEPDFIVKAFCLSTTAGKTIDKGISQYAAKKGKAPASALKKKD